MRGAHPHRPTRDLDLLGTGDNSVPRCERIFREVCSLAVEDDGLLFNAASVRGGTIKEDQEYEGQRLNLDYRLENARISLQIDIGFGDLVTPAATEVTYPVLLDFPAPVLPAYSRESVVAEKFQAMVMLGIANSRMKDFYDLWVLAHEFAFAGPLLSQAIRATFARRRTAVPATLPVASSSQFVQDRAKQTQWRAFVAKSKLDTGGVELDEVVGVLRSFLMPLAESVAAGRLLDLTWPAAGPWQQRESE